MRLVLQFEEPEATAIITQHVEPGKHKNMIPLIFDIDVFRDKEIACDADDLWAQFEMLREVKNRVFFESITDRMQELFR